MPAGNPSSVTLTTMITCPGGVVPTNVVMLVNNVPYPMTETVPGSGLYQVTIPAGVGSATLIAQWYCGSTLHTKPIGQIILYDPSGFVTDAVTGQPVAGATVTLYKVPEWRPRTSPNDLSPNTCESGLSKPANQPWSQPAPVELGVLLNPEIGLINGSPEISPTINPQRTDATGYYGWDVATGCWYVVVEAPGYHSKVSPVVGVPPAVTDLHLTLEPSTRACFDMNADTQLDVRDIQSTAARWGLSNTTPDPDNNPLTPNYDPLYDALFNGVIDVNDVIAVAEQWTLPCQ